MVFSATTPPTFSVYVNYVLSAVGVRGIFSYNIWSIHLEQTRIIQRHRKNSASLFVEIYSQSEYTKYIFSFPVMLRPVDGSWPPLSRLRDHTQTHHTRQDSSGRGTYTWKHTTLTRDRPQCPLGEIRTRNPSTQAAADAPHGHWDQQSVTCHLLVSQSFRQQFEKINWIFQVMHGKCHKQFLYIACK
jgi:hypothetical protein